MEYEEGKVDIFATTEEVSDVHSFLDLLGCSNLDLQQANTLPLVEHNLNDQLNPPTNQPQPANQGFDNLVQSSDLNSLLQQANTMYQYLSYQSNYPSLNQTPSLNFNQGLQQPNNSFQHCYPSFNQPPPALFNQGFHPPIMTNPFMEEHNVECIIIMLTQLNSLIDSCKNAPINQSMKERLCYQLEIIQNNSKDMLLKLNSQPIIDIEALTKNWKLREATGNIPAGPKRKQYDEMMESHSKTLSTLQGQEKAQAIAKIWKEVKYHIALSEKTLLSPESGIINYLGYCKSESFDPFTKRIDGVHVNPDTYNSWLIWLVESHINNKTYKFGSVQRYYSCSKGMVY
ncbi:predicted protein [Naegleria gruberi]|uniref:Predicted protein n=1 Tax=Naegleria gruberi TaxID=5762 RepID=D2W5M2_NAEGR|nr:uncharacterized protein NAEGRDRAFT_76712 [Naegleria gruberi]EFC35629.1 predicted protein [Naegleria gruberi]|eukprot:XP_002668373.1 predicted protein [Naegleria gruberi strain NEG-M]